MRICHLTTTHPPSDMRILKERRTLEHRGLHPTTSEGQHSTLLKWILPGSPKWQHPWLVLELAARALVTDADAFHCHEPDALVIGLLQKFVRGKRVVYDVHEHWPSELPRDIGAPGWLSHIIDPVERWLAGRADAVLAVSESVGQRFPGATILPNYPDVLPCVEVPESEVALRQFSIIGAKLHAYHIRHGIEAVTRLRAEHWPGARLTLIGGLAAPLPPEAPVTCTGYLAQEAIPAALQQAGVGLVLLDPEYENLRIGLPNRLFSYMAAGVPVIASALPEIERVVRDSGCGLVVEPGNPEAIVDAALWLAERPEAAQEFGRNGWRAVQGQYNWGAVEGRLLAVYERLS